MQHGVSEPPEREQLCVLRASLVGTCPWTVSLGTLATSCPAVVAAALSCPSHPFCMPCGPHQVPRQGLWEVQFLSTRPAVSPVRKWEQHPQLWECTP